MTRIQHEDFDDAQDAFEPLTAEQVRELRERQPLLSVWRVVAAQALVGALVACVVWLVSGLWCFGSHPACCAVCSRFDQSGRVGEGWCCSVWFFLVGNGQDWPDRRNVVCGAPIGK